ncbi:skin secretory protein xP2-like [Hyaena hyaena]|uniref:skin secretory protein xP2-like n=1 Tax=Hyaena hyaena TaxID=95912 RepID=UPI001922422B|nr:skin secretory protein xP2-like [Hyaena hyaena]
MAPPWARAARLRGGAHSGLREGAAPTTGLPGMRRPGRGRPPRRSSERASGPPPRRPGADDAGLPGAGVLGHPSRGRARCRAVAGPRWRRRLESERSLLGLPGRRVRGAPAPPSRRPWRLPPRQEPPRASPRGRSLPPPTRSQVAAAECQPRGPAPRSGSVSPPLLPSRAARRSHEAGQQVQRPAALRLPGSELGPHGSGRAAPAAPRPAGRTAEPPSARRRPGRGRRSGAPPPRPREPGWRAAAAAAAGRGSRRGGAAPAPPAPPLPPRLAPTGAGRTPAGSPSPAGRRCPREGRADRSLPRKSQSPGPGRGRGRQPPARSRRPAPSQLRLGSPWRRAALL